MFGNCTNFHRYFPNKILGAHMHYFCGEIFEISANVKPAGGEVYMQSKESSRQMKINFRTKNDSWKEHIMKSVHRRKTLAGEGSQYST